MADRLTAETGDLLRRARRLWAQTGAEVPPPYFQRPITRAGGSLPDLLHDLICHVEKLAEHKGVI